MEMLDYALRYRNKLKWSVIPSTSNETRVPLVGWTEFQKRLPTEKEIRGWWKKYPNANISLVCGKLSGVVVWDCDSKEAHEYMKDKGLYQTLTVQSSESDRLHYYFKYPDFKDDREIRSKNLRDSYLKIPLEYKGNGGLVNLPPSLHYTGVRYKFTTPLSTPIAEMDIWMLELCFLKKKKRTERYFQDKYGNEPEYVLQLLHGVEQGQRDVAAYSLAKFYAKRGFALYEIEIKLLSWNYKNTPPLWDRQIKKCARSGFNAGKQ